MKILLRKIRLDRNMSHRTLSGKSGVALSQIVKIENGTTKNPSLLTMCKLAKALDVTLNDLVHDYD